MRKPLPFLASFAISSTALLSTLEQARAESTYNASCKALGDGISLTSTGRIVLEQRLVKFKPTETYKPQIGQRGVCVIKKTLLDTSGLDARGLRASIKVVMKRDT